MGCRKDRRQLSGTRTGKLPRRSPGFGNGRSKRLDSRRARMSGSKRTRPRMTFDAPGSIPKPVRGDTGAQGAGGSTPVPEHLSPTPPAETNRQRSRIGKRAVTFYVSDEAFRQLGVLSAQTDKTIQSLMLEAVDWVFQTHGLARIARE